MKTTKLFLMMFAAAVALAGCKKYDDTNVVNRLGDLEERVTTLEGAVKALDAQIEAGAMISSVTEIVENGASLGWRIAFTGGSKPSIDIFHGADAAANPNPVEDGKTPLLDVRRNDDGTTTLWVDYGDGKGWQNTGTDLTGPTGSGGGSGGQGSPGPAGPAPKLKVKKNEETGAVTVWYSTAAPDYPDDSYLDTEYDLSVTGPVTTIIDNGDRYAVTLSDKEGTEYFFAKASSAVRLELMFTDGVHITEGETAEVTFVVNPSTAWVPTTDDGGVARWELNNLPEAPTRAGYVTPDEALTVIGVRPMYDDESKKGMYIATITCAPEGFGPEVTEGRHNVALVLNTASDDEAPVLVSSEAFTVWVSEAPEPWIGVDTQTGELVEGTAGTATYEIQTENVADDAPVTVAWCDAQGAAAETPAGIVAPTDAVVTDNAIALTFAVDDTAVAGDYYFTVSAGGATSLPVKLAVAGGAAPGGENVLDEIEDDNFRAAVTELMAAANKGWDTDEDGKLSRAEAAAVTTMDVRGKGITSLAGIEYFTGLTWLNCDSNDLTELNLSANTALIWFDCSDNALTALDLSNNTALTGLNCYNNTLETLDVSALTELTTLNCDNNALEALNVSASAKLTGLNCSKNSLDVLDVSANTALTRLYCNDNSLNVLDVSALTQMTSLNCSYNELDALDVSKNTALTGVLYCSGNDLDALDVSKNTALTTLLCGDGSTALTVTVAPTHNISLGGNLNVSALLLNGNGGLSQITALDTPVNGVTVTAGGTDGGDNITIGGADDENENWEE